MAHNIAPKHPRLIYSNGADWRYATGMEVSDPHLCYIDSAGQVHAVVGPLEYAIAQERSTIDHLYKHSELRQKLEALNLDLSTTSYAYTITQQDPHGPSEKIRVGSDFPPRMYRDLVKMGLNLDPGPGSVFPERSHKTTEEQQKLREVQALNATAFHRLRDILNASTTKSDGKLIWQNQPLTSEVAQAEMNKVLLDGGCTGFNGGPIVAGGAQGAIPHERGHGPLYANQLIVVDCFPQHRNFYNGDLTRTFIKGTPSDAQYQLYDTVRQAQQQALDLIKPNANGADIHQTMEASFKQAGYITGTNENGDYYGYFHGTGHAVGLDIHDPVAPSLSPRGKELEPSHVVTVEPGLYYPPNTHSEVMGGVRIEDIVIVTKQGHENITPLPKSDDFWII